MFDFTFTQEYDPLNPFALDRLRKLSAIMKQIEEVATRPLKVVPKRTNLLKIYDYWPTY